MQRGRPHCEPRQRCTASPQGMPADGPVQVSFTFEDIAVYFSEEEWNLLKEKQRELYRSTMIEHYETLVSLGFLTFKPGIIRRIENGEGLFYMKSENEEKIIASEGLATVGYQDHKYAAKSYEGGTPKSPLAVSSKTGIEAISKQPHSNKKANVTVQKTPVFQNQDNSKDKVVVMEKLTDGFKQAASNKENSIQRSMPPSTRSETLTDNKIFQGDLSPLRSRLQTDSRENVLKGESVPSPNHQGSQNKEKIIQGMKLLITKHPLSDVRRKRTVYRILTPVPEEPPSKDVTIVQEDSSVEHQINGEIRSDCNSLFLSNGDALMQEVSSSGGEDESVTVNECVGELQTSSAENQALKNGNLDRFSAEHLSRRKRRTSLSRRKRRKSNRGIIELRKTLPRKLKLPIVYYLQKEEVGEQQKVLVQQRKSPVIATGCFVKLIDFLQHQKIDSEMNHICSECRKRFPTRAALAHHRKIHTGDRPHLCSECPKRFRKSYHLAVHHQSVHARLRPFKCTVCGKNFAQKGTLMNHAKTHTGEKPYKCNVCERAFSRTEALKVHMRTHTGERPYKCLECGSSFRHSATLVAHSRQHTGEKPFVCSECGKGFTRYETLLGHKRLHTGEKPYACNDCGKRFTQSESLVIHQRTHTGVKPYKCTECGKCFRHSASLVGHKRIHTGERPYKCNQCDQAFIHSGSLRLHLQYHARQRHRCKECRKSFKHLSQLHGHMIVHENSKPRFA